MRLATGALVLLVVLAGCGAPVLPGGSDGGATDGTATTTAPSTSAMADGSTTDGTTSGAPTATTDGSTSVGTTTGTTTDGPADVPEDAEGVVAACAAVSGATDDLPGYGGEAASDRYVEAVDGSPPRLNYEPDGVLRRVECLRGLNATGDVVLLRYRAAYTTSSGWKTDVDDQFGGIGEPGAVALQLYSSKRVAAGESLGYAQRERPVRVNVMNESDLRELYGADQRAVLAHELVHALQYQHRIIGSVDARTTDARLAYHAMVEGDASVVGEQYRRLFVEDSNWSVSERNASVSRDTWPGQLFSQAYYYGYRYFEATDATPGERTEAIRNRPSTTAAVLHPEDGPREPVGDASVPPVDLPNVTRERDDRVGELAVRFALRVNDVPYPRAVRAAEGWRNDSMVYYTRPDYPQVHDAVYWRTRWANESEAAEFADAWRAMLDRLNATRDGDLVVVPGTDHRPAVNYRIERSGATVDLAAGENATLVRDLWAAHNGTDPG